MSPNLEDRWTIVRGSFHRLLYIWMPAHLSMRKGEVLRSLY